MSQAMTFQDAANVIKQSLDIIDVVGRHVALRRAGRNYSGLCPFHQEKSPSFSVSPDKQMFKCFGCGEGGDALSFLMKRENKTYGEIIADLAEERGIEIIREGRQQHKTKEESEILVKLNTLAQKYYQEQLQKAPSVQAYLAERQISAAWQTHFGLGFAPPGWENLVHYLRQKEEMVLKAPVLLEKSGLANIRSEANGYYDRFRNRLIIPIHDERGRIVAFGGRSLDPGDKPKYLNSPETDIYIKNKLLYGFSQAKEAIRSAKYAILMVGLCCRY
jgi:DNA primase